MGWHITESVDEFLQAAGSFLNLRPVENTMLLTLAGTLRIRGSHVYGPDNPVFGWHAADESSVTCAFLQTPPYPALLGAGCPAELADVLAGRPLPGVNGVSGEAEGFAARWSGRTGETVRAGLRSRLFRLGTLVEPPAPPGAARVAGPADRTLLIDWFESFHREVHQAVPPNNTDLVDDKISFGGITVWESDGEVVSLAGNTCRALYERLGYRPVETRVVLEFTP